MLAQGEKLLTEAPVYKPKRGVIDAEDDDRREASEEAVETAQLRSDNPQDPSTLLAFERATTGERLLCVFNFGSLAAAHQVGAGSPSVLWSADAVLAGGNLVLAPFGSAIIKLA